VDLRAGTLLTSPNLGWSDVNPGSMFRGRSALGVPFRLANEADVAALSVALIGPGRTGALSDFVYVSGGIGVGGAIVVGGRVLAGGYGRGGEIGHVSVDVEGPTCACGSTGCLEQYVGWPALSAKAGVPPRVSATELADAVIAGDHAAITAVEGAARALGVAVASVLNLVDVPTVVLGGTLAALAEVISPTLQETLQRRVLTARWSPVAVRSAPQIVAAGATGAALSALADVLENPAACLVATCRGA
jgi:predicted NBD/HSP70 family sugar kinase